MTVQCIDCERLNLKSNPRMARHGFGQCQLLPAYNLRSLVYHRECDKFIPADADKAAKRREFFKAAKEQP